MLHNKLYASITIVALQLLLCSYTAYGMDEKESSRYTFSTKSNQKIHAINAELSDEKTNRLYIKELKLLHEKKQIHSVNLMGIRIPYSPRSPHRPNPLESDDPLKPNFYGRTVLHYAASYGKDKLIDHLLSEDNFPKYLPNNNNHTFTLLEMGGEMKKIISLKDNNGYTAAMYAFLYQRWDCIESLMQKSGVDIIKQEIDEFIKKIEKDAKTETAQEMKEQVPYQVIAISQPSTIIQHAIFINNNYVVTNAQPTPRRVAFQQTVQIQQATPRSVKEVHWLKRLFCSCTCGGSSKSS